MKKLFAITLVFLMTSCVTRKACERKFPSTEYDSTRIVTNIVTVYRDTTVYIELPGDTVYKVTDINEGVSELITPLAISYAWVKDGKLEHRLEQKDTLLGATIKNAIKNTTKTANKDKVLHQVNHMNQLTDWQSFQIYFGRVVFFIGCILCLMRTTINKIKHDRL